MKENGFGINLKKMGNVLGFNELGEYVDEWRQS